MGLVADALGQTKRVRPGYECSMCRTMRELDEADRAAIEAEFQKEIGDPTRISDSQIAAILTQAGFEMHRITVSRHRRSECAKR